MFSQSKLIHTPLSFPYFNEIGEEKVGHREEDHQRAKGDRHADNVQFKEVRNKVRRVDDQGTGEHCHGEQ